MPGMAAMPSAEASAKARGARESAPARLDCEFAEFMIGLPKPQQEPATNCRPVPTKMQNSVKHYRTVIYPSLTNAIVHSANLDRKTETAAASVEGVHRPKSLIDERASHATR